MRFSVSQALAQGAVGQRKIALRDWEKKLAQNRNYHYGGGVESQGGYGGERWCFDRSCVTSMKSHSMSHNLF